MVIIPYPPGKGNRLMPKVRNCLQITNFGQSTPPGNPHSLSPCHCEARRAVAICFPYSFIYEKRTKRSTDCQEVNCPEGAREATLGCVTSLLAMTAVIGGWSFFWNTSYNAKWTSAPKRKSIFDSNHPEGIPQLAQWANFILRQQNITFPKGNASLSRQGKHHLAQRKSFSLCHSGWSFYDQIFTSSQSIISCLPSSVMGNSRFSSISDSS